MSTSSVHSTASSVHQLLHLLPVPFFFLVPNHRPPAPVPVFFPVLIFADDRALYRLLRSPSPVPCSFWEMASGTSSSKAQIGDLPRINCPKCNLVVIRCRSKNNDMYYKCPNHYAVRWLLGPGLLSIASVCWLEQGFFCRRMTAASVHTTGLRFVDA